MASVDVAIPCFNYGRYLRACVGSVLSQGIAELRVLIVDNASEDDSLLVARELAAADPRIEVLARPVNMGPHASFNAGIDWARAEYFTILCADDMLAPGSLARAVAVMEAHPEVGMAYGKAWSAVEGEPLPASFAAPVEGWRVLAGTALLERFAGSAVCHVAGCGLLTRTAVQQAAGHYREALPHTDDFELWMRFAALGAVAELDAVQGIFRVHPANRSVYQRRDHVWDLVHCEAAFASFFAHEGAALPDAARLRHRARRSLGERAYWSAISHLCRGEAGTAFKLARFAFRLVPAAFLLPPLGYLLRRQDSTERLGWLLRQLLGRPARTQPADATAEHPAEHLPGSPPGRRQPDTSPPCLPPTASQV